MPARPSPSPERLQETLRTHCDYFGAPDGVALDRFFVPLSRTARDERAPR